ncbi:ABC transporter permease [Cellulosimicrobium cellulans]|uniref:ABC transporter permease n=1 Tax=Cellulosimicrobium cellulans TaxID=1710 RepID=UPI00130D8C2B|nr:ABC transporter permease [Cellulosimicrobium cellulans]
MTAVHQTLLLTQWRLRRQTAMLPIIVVEQTFFAIAAVLGYGLLIGDPDPATATYLATGAPTIMLVIVGMVTAPHELVVSRAEGSMDWIRTLPVPRLSYLVADLLMWVLIALPGTVLGIVTGVLRFDVDLSIAPWVVPGALLVSLGAASVGYAIGTLLPPTLAQTTTQVLLFVVLLFSPVSYPADRLPGWLQGLHDWLPIQPMADLMRAGLAQDTFDLPARSLVVLLSWCAVGVAGATWALRRRA